MYLFSCKTAILRMFMMGNGSIIKETRFKYKSSSDIALPKVKGSCGKRKRMIKEDSRRERGGEGDSLFLEIGKRTAQVGTGIGGPESRDPDIFLRHG